VPDHWPLLAGDAVLNSCPHRPGNPLQHPGSQDLEVAGYPPCSSHLPRLPVPPSKQQENGKAIARNPGQIRLKLLVDHGGTPNDPSDDEVLSEEIVKGSTGRSDDFCEAAVPAMT
jgi:hypothetical protein